MTNTTKRCENCNEAGRLIYKLFDDRIMCDECHHADRVYSQQHLSAEELLPLDEWREMREDARNAAIEAALPTLAQEEIDLDQLALTGRMEVKRYKVTRSDGRVVLVSIPDDEN